MKSTVDILGEGSTSNFIDFLESLKDHNCSGENSKMNFNLILHSETRAASRMKELELLALSYFAGLGMKDGVLQFYKNKTDHQPTDKQLKRFGQSCVIAGLSWILSRFFMCCASLQQAIISETREYQNQLKEMKKFILNKGGGLAQLYSRRPINGEGREEQFTDILKRSEETTGVLTKLQNTEDREKLAYSILTKCLIAHPMFQSSLLVASQLTSTKAWGRIKSSLEQLFANFVAREPPEFDEELAFSSIKEFIKSNPEEASPTYQNFPHKNEQKTSGQLKPADFFSQEQEIINEKVEWKMKWNAETRAKINDEFELKLGQRETTDEALWILRRLRKAAGKLMEDSRELEEYILSLIHI